MNRGNDGDNIFLNDGGGGGGGYSWFIPYILFSLTMSLVSFLIGLSMNALMTLEKILQPPELPPRAASSSSKEYHVTISPPSQEKFKQLHTIPINHFQQPPPIHHNVSQRSIIEEEVTVSLDKCRLQTIKKIPLQQQQQ